MYFNGFKRKSRSHKDFGIFQKMVEVTGIEPSTEVLKILKYNGFKILFLFSFLFWHISSVRIECFHGILLLHHIRIVEVQIDVTDGF